MYFYNFTVVRAHNKVEAELKECGLLEQLPPMPNAFKCLEHDDIKDVPIDLVDNTYADDCFFLLAIYVRW